MKILIILFSLYLLGFTNGNLDKCKGLGNYIFGTTKNQYDGLFLEFEDGDSQLYSVKSDEIKIDNVHFDFIRITFIKNKLSAIALSTKNDTSSAFLKYLVNKYGIPFKNKNNYEWRGKNIQLIFEFYKNSKDASIDFYYNVK